MQARTAEENQPLIQAAKNGNISALMLYAENNPEILRLPLDEHGHTTLHFATQFDQLEGLKYILGGLQQHTSHSTKSIIEETTDSEGANIIFTAAAWGAERVLNYLVEQQKVNINIQVDDQLDKRSPLHVAVYYNQASIIHTLLKHNANLLLVDKDNLRPDQITTRSQENCLAKKRDELYKAINSRSKDLIFAFLEENTSWLYLPLNSQQQTLLHLLAQLNLPELFKEIALFAKKHSIFFGNLLKQEDDFQLTPLDYLALNNDERTYLNLAYLEFLQPTSAKKFKQLIFDTYEKLANNVKEGGINYIYHIMQLMPHAYQCLAKIDNRNHIKSSNELLKVIQIQPNAAEYLFNDTRLIRLLKKSSNSKMLANLVRALPPALLLTHEKLLVDCIVRYYCIFFKEIGSPTSLNSKCCQFFLEAHFDTNNDALVLGNIALHGLFHNEKNFNQALVYFSLVPRQDMQNYREALYNMAHIYLNEAENNPLMKPFCISTLNTLVEFSYEAWLQNRTDNDLMQFRNDMDRLQGLLQLEKITQHDFRQLYTSKHPALLFWQAKPNKTEETKPVIGLHRNGL